MDDHPGFENCPAIMSLAKIGRADTHALERPQNGSQTGKVAGKGCLLILVKSIAAAFTRLRGFIEVLGFERAKRALTSVFFP